MIISQVLTQSQIQDLHYGRNLPTQFDCRLWSDFRLGHTLDLSGKINNGLTTSTRFV